MSAPRPRVAFARFPMTYCSQCGKEQGPGNEGVSSCSDHRKPGEPQIKPAVFLGYEMFNGERFAVYRGVAT